MAIDWKEQLPEWNAEGIEPEEAKKIQGWIQNERPPANVINWLFNRTYKSLEELRSTVENIDITGGNSGNVTIGGAWKFVYNEGLKSLDLVHLIADEEGHPGQCKFRLHMNGNLDIKGIINEGAYTLYPICDQFICDTAKCC